MLWGAIHIVAYSGVGERFGSKKKKKKKKKNSGSTGYLSEFDKMTSASEQNEMSEEMSPNESLAEGINGLFKPAIEEIDDRVRSVRY